jgi:hypothetical protein
MVNDDGRAERRVEQTVGMKLVGMDEIFKNNETEIIPGR